MIFHEANVIKALEAPEKYSVFYYFSTEDYLVQSYARKTVARLLHDTGAEVTRVDGPVPSMEEIVAAAGTISFFGTKRIVEISLLEPAAMNDADVAALCDIMQSLENATLVLTTVFKDDKAKTTKKAKQLIAAAEKTGFAAELSKPAPQDAKRFAAEYAASLGATLFPTAASALIERTGTEYFALQTEIEKLAACAQYGEISRELIQRMSTQNIEADVFEMVRAVTARQLPRALEKLRQLLDLQNEPIAVTAALAGSFVDLYRVKCGGQQKRNYAAVFKDFAYRGSDYRLKKSAETASGYTKQQLETILFLLCKLDLQLKSSAADSVALLQTALCEISAVGVR
ncbi:MAG: DNA polymerase III subunit delta [Ruthenibacterium sp.]